MSTYHSKGFGLMLTVSLSVAAAAFVGSELIYSYYSNSHAALRFEPLFLKALPAFWGIVVLVAFFRYRLRGLWFLFGAPLALWWLYFFETLVLACKQEVVSECLCHLVPPGPALFRQRIRYPATIQPFPKRLRADRDARHITAKHVTRMWSQVAVSSALDPEPTF
jgi:hypothetical protein